MRGRVWAGVFVIAIGLAPGLRPCDAAEAPKPHRVVIQVDQNDPAVMNQALNNAENIVEHYNHVGQEVQVEVVAYGPGLHMLRDDTSPVKDRIKRLADDTLPPIKFSACGVTKAGMEKREGKKVLIVPQATVVPSGAVRVMELQERGWSYLRP